MIIIFCYFTPLSLFHIDGGHPDGLQIKGAFRQKPESPALLVSLLW